MSVLINISKIPKEKMQSIDTALNITIEDKNKKTKIYVHPYRVQGVLGFIPFNFAIKNSFMPMKHTKLTQVYTFKGTLRAEQKIVRDEAFAILNRVNSLLLSVHVGFGKSILATYFAYKIRMKTLILVNRIILMEQWKKVLNDFLEAPKIQVLKSSDIVDWDCDFFIMNAINMPKFGYMPEIGLLIIDEVHLIMSKVLSTCFQYITPTYLIGLSATSYRLDGFHILFNLYFGGEENSIDRKLQREHIVHVVDTGFSPRIVRLPRNNNKVDWNDILNQQALNEDRNRIIVKIIENFPDLNFMILCKRVDQIKLIQKLLEEKSILAEYIYGEHNPDKTLQSRILIGTIQKLGTGFDAPWLNALIIAADLEAYFIQYLGRVFRKKEIVPIVFDLVDQNNILKKHFRTREETYISHGGIIRSFVLNK